MDVNIKRTVAAGDIYVGGVAGYSEGQIHECENTGRLSDNSMSKYHYVGGITGYSTAGAELDKCKNSGKMMHTSTRNVGEISGMTNTVCVGGIVGKNYGVLKSSGYQGSSEIMTDANTVYLGGVAGSIDAVSEDPDHLRRCYCTEGSISYSGPDMKNTPSSLSRYVRIGGLVGMLNVPLELDCTEITVNCDISTTSMENNGSLIAGGVIGYATKDLTLTSPKWNGSLEFNMSNVRTTSNEVCVGGILGKSSVAEISLIGARTSGTIHVNAVSTTWEVPTAIGGVVGCAADGCKVSDAINGSDLKWTSTHSSTANGGQVSSGGIVGRIDKGIAVISGCTNNGSVHNVSNPSSNWESGKVLGARTGGILGTYGFVKDGDNLDMNVFESASSNNITITDCHTTSEVLGHRGLVGGVAGYLYNAVVADCSYTGISSNARINNNLGGIAGAVEKTTIKDCKVQASLYGAAYRSYHCKVGGIVACLYTDSTISNCRYFGDITGKNEGDVVYYGGIVGEAQAGCTVKSCSFGGSILEKAVTSENYTEYIIGNKAIEAADCSYWDGE